MFILFILQYYTVSTAINNLNTLTADFSNFSTCIQLKLISKYNALQTSFLLNNIKLTPRNRIIPKDVDAGSVLYTTYCVCMCVCVWERERER